MTEEVPGRRERKKEETKQKIFLAAVEMFSKKGFEHATVDEIAERADVSKGTFFNYFPRKEALLHYLAESWIEIAQDTAQERERSAEERILELFALAAASYGEHRELARLVARFSMEQLCGATPEAQGTHVRLHELFIEIWKQGQGRGEFDPAISPATAHGVLGSVFVGGVMWWLGTPDGRVDPEASRYSLPEVVRRNLTLVFDGLRAGRKS
jgi:AcrR family transcriptional regulator